MATAACRAGRLSCCFPWCPQCQEKPIIRNAISYIYLSLSPPASSSRLPTRPCRVPPSPSGHTSLLLMLVTTCPSLGLRHSLPKPQASGHGVCEPAGSTLVCHWCVRDTHVCSRYAFYRRWSGRFLSQTSGKGGLPSPFSLDFLLTGAVAVLLCLSPTHEGPGAFGHRSWEDMWPLGRPLIPSTLFPDAEQEAPDCIPRHLKYLKIVYARRTPHPRPSNQEGRGGAGDDKRKMTKSRFTTIQIHSCESFTDTRDTTRRAVRCQALQTFLHPA